MKRIIIGLICIPVATLHAQDSTKSNSKFVFTGSADGYYRYNFADPRSGHTNNLTSFTNSQNSFELGMASLRVDHSLGKASATIDLGFGRRADEFSYNDGTGNGFFSLANIKQLYASYAVSSKIKITAGKWATHIGYELVDAYLNRNYSMSYMFSYGPFFHTGIKADVALTGKTGFMAGLANPTDYSTTTRSAKFVIAQFSTGTANDKIKGWLNYQGGSYAPGINLNQVDMVLSAAVSSQFGMAYNGTVQFRKEKDASSNQWWGSALYLTYDPCARFGLTFRSEYFDDHDGIAGIGNKITALTLSPNIRLNSLTLIPELRYEHAANDLLEKHNGDPTQHSFTAILAATYHF